MASDRRLGPRKQVTLEVLVSDRKRGAKSCLTRDISLDGAFIETKNVALKKKANIELILKIPSNRGPTDHALKAKVASVEKHGATVIFGNLEEQTYKALVDLLYPQE
ncbi:MAG: PilZ domain-containing protein [Gammaproteobacteria bacterium]|nr:PilZ domain-containing protein [Gammaproteobacteria bacterium]